MVEFVRNNWVWIVPILVFVGMQRLGFSCCGGRQRSRPEKGAKKESQGQEKSCH